LLDDDFHKAMNELIFWKIGYSIKWMTKKKKKRKEQRTNLKDKEKCGSFDFASLR